MFFALFLSYSLIPFDGAAIVLSLFTSSPPATLVSLSSTGSEADI